jgi:hypothetical protein
MNGLSPKCGKQQGDCRKILWEDSERYIGRSTQSKIFNNKVNRSTNNREMTNNETEGKKSPVYAKPLLAKKLQKNKAHQIRTKNNIKKRIHQTAIRIKR